VCDGADDREGDGVVAQGAGRRRVGSGGAGRGRPGLNTEDLS
jgi:hypothetical protein